MEILHSYINGNVKVTLYTDGTKIQEWSDDELANPIFPNSMDIKITNFCDLNCKFCHEMSNINGKHGDLEFLKSILENDKSVVEGQMSFFDMDDSFMLEESVETASIIEEITIQKVYLLGD